MRGLLVGALVLATAAPAAAGTISGTITAQAGGAAIASAEVRVWVEGVKGWSILSTTVADGGGNYSFTLSANSYLIDVRGPAASGVNWGDRWYDVAAPASGGYVGEDADEIAVSAAGAVTGVDIAMEILGGSDGAVFRPGGIEAPSMMVRMERRGEPRIHHNDMSKSPTGSTSMRGMVPASDYQLMIYDPTGVRDTLLLGGPYTITAGANGALGNLTMADYGADPYESNNAASCSAVSISATALHMDPPQPWSSSNARIGPLASGDVDWFCYTAVEGDRLFVEATTAFTFSAATRYSPWTDPLLSFWQGARVTKLVENDDGGTGPLDSLVDTGPLAAGCHCAAVTTFGDPSYVGSGQTSTGRYQLRVTMGNRPPGISIKKGTTEVPPSPATFAIDEGDTMVLTLTYDDADHDTPTRTFVHRDNTAAIVADGTLVLGATSGSYTWTAGAGAAALSPYTLVLQAGDAEFTRTKTVQLVVNAVNMPPELPVPISPIDDAVVMDGATPLVWTNADDPDGDVVSYDLELYVGDTAGAPVQTASVAGGAGTTSFTPTALAENTRAFWRVRGKDPGGGLSPWTAYEGYLVDSANDPPETPILIKPAENELLTVRRPGLSVLNVQDPEDDDVEFIFEIARDLDFAVVVWTSIVVPQNELSATTMTTMDEDLEWGLEFYARVMAQDVRGGMSEWSEPHHFRVKENIPPGSPVFEPGCAAMTYEEEAPTDVVVTNVEDPESEVVTFELELFEFDADPATADPVYTASAEMDGAAIITAIPIDLSDVPNGHYRYRVRAFDGTDGSGWIECELTLNLPEETPGSPDGGCCSTGTRPVGAAVLGLLVVGALVRRRRR